MTITRPLCYCFQHSYEDVAAEVAAGKPDEIRQSIVARCRAGEARCEETNPSGSCCLGEVRAAYAMARDPAAGISSSAAGSVDAANCCDESTPKSVPSVPGKDRSRLTTGAALLVAAGSSACCWLPLVLAVAGVSAVGVGGFFEVLRPYLIATAALLLAGGFYLLFVRPRSCEVAGGCERRPRAVTRMQKGIYCCAAVVCFAFMLFPQYGTTFFVGGAASDTQAVSESADTRVFRVSGMTCAGCVAGLTTSLREQPDVLSVSVDYPTALARLSVIVSADDRQILEAIARSGFEGERIE